MVKYIKSLKTKKKKKKKKGKILKNKNNDRTNTLPHHKTRIPSLVIIHAREEEIPRNK